MEAICIIRNIAVYQINSMFSSNKLIKWLFFIFIFTKGIDVLTRTNSYETPYGGPDTTTECCEISANKICS